VLGIRESARLNNIIVFVKVAIVLAVIAFGFFYVDTANWSPFIPAAFTDAATGAVVPGKYGAPPEPGRGEGHPARSRQPPPLSVH
jgi:amino acid transporter